MPLSADLGYRQAATDFSRKNIGDLSMSWHCLNLAGIGIRPERVRTALAFEIAAVFAQMAKQRFSLHCTVTVS